MEYKCIILCVDLEKFLRDKKGGGGGGFNVFFGSFIILYVDLRGSLNFLGGGWGCLIIMYLYVCVY